MDCRNPNCDGKLGWSDGKCKQCGTWRRQPAQRIVKPKTQRAKPTSQATVKPQAPTKEELLLPMSDSELLRKIAMHSERTDNHLSHIRLLILVIILGFIGLLSP